MMLRFNTYSSDLISESLHSQCQYFRKILHKRTPDMLDKFELSSNVMLTTFCHMKKPTLEKWRSF